MAFRFTKVKTFTADVTVPVVNDKGGYDKSTFKAIFKFAEETELDKLRAMNNTELVRDRLVGWEMTDADTKEEVPFTDATRDAALAIPPTSARVAAAFWDTIYGARAKNL